MEFIIVHLCYGEPASPRRVQVATISGVSLELACGDAKHRGPPRNFRNVSTKLSDSTLNRTFGLGNSY